MHVGHIRSTVIGDCALSHPEVSRAPTISDNHLGDWGTQFGMIIYGFKHFGDRAALAQNAVEELTRLYKLVNSLVEYQEARREKIPAIEQRIAEAERQLSEVGDGNDPKKRCEAATAGGSAVERPASGPGRFAGQGRARRKRSAS